METKDIFIPYKKSNRDFHYYNLSDLHVGTKHFAEEQFKEKVAEIRADPFARWVGLGDYGDFIIPSDPRWEYKDELFPEWLDKENIVDSELEHIEQLLTPIASKCDGLIEGNHEDALYHHYHENVMKLLCKHLKVSYLGFSCFIRLHFERENSSESHMITGHFEHGSGNAITKGAKLNRLRRSMDSFEADIYGYAHMHDLITDTKPYMTLNKDGKILAMNKVGAVTGSWLRAYTEHVPASYAEKKGYPPTTIGCPVFIYNPTEGRLEVKGS